MSVKNTNDVFKNLFISEKKKANVKTNIISSPPNKKKNTNIDEKNIDENNSNEKNIDEKNIDEKNIDEKNIDEENIAYTFQMKKKLAANILKLEKFEQIQIYHIIKNKDEKFTKNQNGILFDLHKFEDSTIHSLDAYVKMTTTYRKQKKQDNQSLI
jgi:hypothetical protein